MPLDQLQTVLQGLY